MSISALLLTGVGCVDRRFVVSARDATNPTVPITAQIFQDGTPLGNTPVDSRYEYTGEREFRATAPNYQPLVKRVKFEPKWYDYPGLDLFAEVFWPFRIEDVRRVELLMEPAQPLRIDELQGRAEELRGRGLTLPPPSIPNDRQSGNTPPPDATPTLPAPRPVSPTGLGSYIGK